MARDLYDVDQIYRVRFNRFFADGTEHTYYQGPYDAATTAKAIATRFNRQVQRLNKGRDIAIVEAANTTWTAVE